MKLNIQLFGGRGASSSGGGSSSKNNFIVVSSNDGTSKIINKKNNRTIAFGLNFQTATTRVNMMNAGKAKPSDYGYGGNNGR